jgi:hypothetical protein
MDEIPVPVFPEGGGGIPASATTLPQEGEAPEAQPYLISFRRYNEKECQLEDGMMGHYSLDALRMIKGMGTRVAYTPNATHINNENEYTQLFRKLDDIEDLDIREIRLSGKFTDKNGENKTVDKGRLFFFTIGYTLYIVAIRAHHYETKKK